MRELILDLETTGLEVEKGHRVIEIGILEVVDKIRTPNFFHKFINPQREISPGASRIHGIKDSFLIDKPKFSEVVDEFLEFIGEDPLVIHNASFDMKFINAELCRLGRKAIAYNRAIDTLLLARKKFPGSPANLDYLCKRFNVCNKARKEQGHGALIDSELLYKVYINLTGHVRSELFPQDIHESATRLSAPSSSSTKRASIPSRRFAYEQDSKAHDAFVASIKNKIWDEV
jgi:DNA polymerase-3 subunit epsilon